MIVICGEERRQFMSFSTTRVAVLAGDFMFAQASWYLVIKDFVSGEVKQASSLFDCDIQLDDYLLKSFYKTAFLVTVSTKGTHVCIHQSLDLLHLFTEISKPSSRLSFWD